MKINTLPQKFKKNNMKIEIYNKIEKTNNVYINI